MKQLKKEYLNYLESMRFSERTIHHKRYKIKKFIFWLEKNCDLKKTSELRLDHLKKWHNYISTLRKKNGHPVKAAYSNAHISDISEFIKYLAKNGYVQLQLLEALPKLKVPKHLPKSVLSHNQVKKFLSGIATNDLCGYRNRTILEMLYTSGVRISELLNLNLSDIDLDHHTFLVTGKGNKQRIVPLGKTAVKYLESYIVGIRPYFPQKRSETALFLSMKGKRLAYNAFVSILDKLVKNTDMGVRITAHTFRRSCTTELIRSGANMYHVKELLGHESLDTLKHYTKLTIMDLKKTHAKCHPREKDSN